MTSSPTPSEQLRAKIATCVPPNDKIVVRVEWLDALASDVAALEQREARLRAAVEAMRNYVPMVDVEPTEPLLNDERVAWLDGYEHGCDDTVRAIRALDAAPDDPEATT